MGRAVPAVPGPLFLLGVVGKQRTTKAADQDGGTLRIPVAAVDRDATLAANRARGLRLYLPAE